MIYLTWINLAYSPKVLNCPTIDHPIENFINLIQTQSLNSCIAFI